MSPAPRSRCDRREQRDDYEHGDDPRSPARKCRDQEDGNHDPREQRGEAMDPHERKNA